MKLQLGLLHFGGQPTTGADLARILGELGSYPAETAGEVADGSLLMAYRGDRITPEDESETQPLRDGPYTLTWDGRLDNREEIADRIGLGHLRSVPDPVIVLKAYADLGERVIADLIGEFALVLWCRATRSLSFARSTCGARPLYYVLTNNYLIWCSNFSHLVRISGVNLAVNDHYVLQYLVTTPDVTHTPLANVEAIPPNRVVRFENGQMRYGSELWNPIHTSAVRQRSEEEYEEECREKITQAVRVRLRSRHPVFAELSGGLDSSTIVLTADHILRSRGQSPQNLQTASCVYEESKSADERPFIRAVEEKRGVETHLIHEEDQQITLGLGDTPFTGLPHTLNCFPGRYERISTLMRQHKARVLLTGRGGDHLFWSAPDGAPLVADELCQMNLRRAHRECRTWSCAAAVPYYKLLANKALPLALGSVFPSRYFYERPELPTWVHPKHRSTMRALTADFEGYTSWHSVPSRRVQMFMVDRMFRMLGSGFGQEHPQIYASHPYSHRPLIDFCLSVPVSQFLRDGQTRSLMRRALRELLPRKTAKRVSKGLVDETIIRALQREQANLSDLHNWQVCQRGYVVYPRLAETVRQAQLGMHLSGPLIRLFSLERWLRSLSRVAVKSPCNVSVDNFAEIREFSARRSGAGVTHRTPEQQGLNGGERRNHGLRSASSGGNGSR
ncbi:MAG TPA: asparagine synthase-related protein [Candidatus Angelobacter sp.]